MILTKANK